MRDMHVNLRESAASGTAAGSSGKLENGADRQTGIVSCRSSSLPTSASRGEAPQAVVRHPRTRSSQVRLPASSDAPALPSRQQFKDLVRMFTR
eukprot:6319229-Pyramimonas_sp.AAC.1